MQQFRALPTLPSLLRAPLLPFIHRDVSWLQFNDRVLAESRHSSGNPVLERAKFLAISASNLDEFFMIRLSSLNRAIRTPAKGRSAAETARLEQIRDAILESVAKFIARQAESFDILIQDLAANRIFICRSFRDGDTAASIAADVFEKEVLPKLTPPETFDLSQLGPMPNLKTAVLFPGQLWFSVPRAIPNVFYRADPGTGNSYFFFLDDLLETFLGRNFGVNGQCGIIRLTRDADITVDIEEEDPASIPDIVRTELGSRERGHPMRLQYRGDLSDDVLSHLATLLKLSPMQVIPAPAGLYLNSLWAVARQAPVETPEEKNLRYPPLPKSVPLVFEHRAGLFQEIAQRDYLLHHPYDSFDAFVDLLSTAADDPDVIQIEQTVYRVDKDSPLIEALKRAAQTKKVRVFIELRARFDEFNNLRLADELRKAGVEIHFGFGKLKLHAKVTLITRREGQELRQYSHLSTGNYNSVTAKQYTDLAVITANADIGNDARKFFDSVALGKVPTGFKRLLSAPIQLHRRLLALIEGETEAARRGEKTRIVAKVNALVDEEVIEALYRASQAGVAVDLVVRGACSLIPGVKRLSENIRVVSVVDRFLEHSRLYYFENAKVMYLSSADWMPRNFFSRLELAFPILDERIYTYIERFVIPAYFADNVKARELTLQGIWKKRSHRGGTPGVRAQALFEDLAKRKYEGTPLEGR